MDHVVAECAPRSKCNQAPRRIVVHAMAEFLDLDPTDKSALDFLRSQKLSAHILASPGGTLIRMLDDHTMGAHAKGANKDCLGLEILVPGVHTWATFVERIKTPYMTISQWDSTVWQVRQWRDLYSIELDDIQRHSDISPGRKVDPGDGFDWPEFIDEVS